MNRNALRENQIREASVENIRRLAKFVGVKNAEQLPKLALIDELGWKGVVTFDFPQGCY